MNTQKMTKDDLPIRTDLTGLLVTVNGCGDLAMEDEARPFIGQKCKVIRTQKNGLIRVRLLSNEKLEYAVPLRNISSND